MSQILKARNRIVNRSKLVQDSQQIQEQYVNQSPHIQLATKNFNKKFNISSISMKFTKNQQQAQSNQKSIIYENIKLSLNSQNQSRSQYGNRQKSPQFSRTQRANPIRQFQPYKASTLSESKSLSSLKRLSKDKDRRISMTSRALDEQYENKSGIRTTLQFPDILNSQSPIRNTKKSVHFQPLNLLIARQQNRRAQSPYKPRECAKQYTQTLINQVKLNKKTYTDQTFPPELTIAFPKKSLYQLQKDLQFQHLSKCYQNLDIQTALIHNCEPTLINPGKFTNPYLYSAIRILAQYPQKVLSLFQDQKVNPQGIYYVNICRDGTWRYVIVDDYVPVRLEGSGKKNSQFLGISAVDANGIAQTWPSLIQKALAKVYGTYYDLCFSRSDGICPLLRSLTGFPVSKYDLIKDVRSYILLIDTALKRQHIVIVQQILPQFQLIAQLKGISPQESYQILQVQKNNFVLRNLADFDLVTMMTFDEVMMFSALLIFRKQENYVYVSQKLRHRKGFFSCLRVWVPQNLKCYWDVWQNNPAYYKNHMENGVPYEVSPFKLLIQPVSTPSQSNQFDSAAQPETIIESGKQISMKRGEYVISAHLCQSMKQMDFTLSYYGEKDIKIQRVKNISQNWSQNCCCIINKNNPNK